MYSLYRVLIRQKKNNIGNKLPHIGSAILLEFGIFNRLQDDIIEKTHQDTTVDVYIHTARLIFLNDPLSWGERFPIPYIVDINNNFISTDCDGTFSCIFILNMQQYHSD